jgi:pyruvate kinase
MNSTDEGGVEVRSVDVNYKDLVNDIKVGDTVLVDNGLLRLEVLTKDDARIRCRVLIPGELKSRRHINLPGVKVNLPSFTEKDRADTTVGLEEGIDFVALSFVREAKDIELLRRFLSEKKSRCRIIAKIEDQSAIDNLDSIVSACDGLMVARGDLGIECPFEELPVIQRRAVRACLAQGRPVIVATHMLESMISQPVPTRAEITDVANAVYELADCVMLSGETTIGKYPLECVQMLDKISRRIEAEETVDSRPPAVFTGERMKVLHSAVVLANELPRSKLLTFTRHGFMAQGLAMLRPVHSPILAFTPSPEVCRQLRLLRAVEPFLMPLGSEPDVTIENAIALLRAPAASPRRQVDRRHRHRLPRPPRRQRPAPHGPVTSSFSFLFIFLFRQVLRSSPAHAVHHVARQSRPPPRLTSPAALAARTRPVVTCEFSVSLPSSRPTTSPASPRMRLWADSLQSAPPRPSSSVHPRVV